MSKKLNPAETLREARDFAHANTESEFLLVREESGSAEVGKLQIGKPVQVELADTVASCLTDYIDDLREGKTRARELDVANTISEESIMQCTHVKNLPASDLFKSLLKRGHDTTTTYSADPKPDFQFIRISEPDGKRLLGIQSYNSVRLVETEDSVSMLYDGKEYERFRGDILVIQPTLNAVYYDSWLFIDSPKSFEKMFNMREEYEKRAKEAINSFEDSGIQFADRNKIADWLLSHINILRGMYEIYDKDIHKEADPEQIEKMIEEYELDQRSTLDYTRRNGEIELSVDEYQHTWKLLKLLSGKYAEDEIRGNQWEIDSGQRL